jgi:hypothetical protein
MLNRFKILTLSILIAHSVSADEIPGSADLRMNQIQVIASHNSYHLLAEEPLFSQVKAVYPKAAEWEYEHKPLNEQLDHGVRSLEIDLYYHPEGIRVFHVPQFDMRSNCETFVDCATLVRDWSRAHPRHVPLLILLELKEEPVPQANVPVLPFDEAALAQLEKEVNGVFNQAHLLRPDDVRGDAPTLRDAIRTQGWPKLDDLRGRVFFVLHTGNKRYAEDHPTLEGRAMFLQAYGDEDYAAVYVLNDPADPEIPKRVKDGFIVRTRADANMAEAVANDYTRFKQALTSGAQIITTDYPPGEPHAKTGYTVAFEDGSVARANPVALAE